MLTRFALALALAGALFTLPLSPTRALSESQQDAAIASLQSAVKSLQSTVASQQTTITSQATQIAALQKKTNGFYASTDPNRTDGKKYTELYFKGLNLHIINGLGATNGEPSNPSDVSSPIVNGLGNVIIGYNQTRGTDGSGNSLDVHTGSHCLIVGDYQNYSNFGGVAFGAANVISGAYACATGGGNGTVSGYLASISGGNYNTAFGTTSSISGGDHGATRNYASSISGGSKNIANGDYSSISGGLQNGTGNSYSSISGGYFNTASGESSSVSGGSGHTASGQYNWAAGGLTQPN